MSAADVPPAPPTRGEVWLARLPRAVGAELQRVRPAVIVNSPAFDAAPVRIIVPLTTWVAEFIGSGNKLLVEATERNGLDADGNDNPFWPHLDPLNWPHPRDVVSWSVHLPSRRW